MKIKLLTIIVLIFTLNNFVALTAIYSKEIKQKSINPLVISDLLMGGTINNIWVDNDKMSKMIKGGEVYQVYDFSKYLGYGKGSKIEIEESAGAQWIEIKTKGKKIDDYIAIGGKWNIYPRKITQQSLNDNNCKNIVKEVLQKNGLKNVKIILKQNYSVDIDGDGSEEVFITASNIDYNDLKTEIVKNTYSIIILRKIINNKAENIVLQKSIYADNKSFEEGCSTIYKIDYIADLNNDGVMEVVAEDKYYEGMGYTVIEIKGDKVKEALSNGWGL